MIGAGLKQARLLKGWTLTRLAEELGKNGFAIKSRTISKYENGMSFPSASFLLLAASILNVPSTYFMHVPDITITWRAFRKRSGFGIRRQDEVKQYAADLTELHIELRSLLNLEGKIDFPETKAVTNAYEAESAAGELRKRWDIEEGPFRNLVSTVEDRGVVVIGKDDTSEKFDGLSGWCDEYPVIVINRNMSTDRLRFTVAHEIGHLVMDTSSAAEDEEKLAHRFAAALLVPAKDAKRALGESLDWDVLKDLKRTYGLSMSAGVRRAKDLNIISGHQYKQLMIEMSDSQWRKIEPVNYEGNEEPVHLEQMTQRAISEGTMSVHRLSYSDADFLAPVAETQPTGEFPSATELMQMDEVEREGWMTKMFDLAEGMEFEVFEAYGEEEF